LATALLREIVRTHASADISVSTAEGNRPALRLYATAGFLGDRRWTTDDGIPMLTLRRGAACDAAPQVGSVGGDAAMNDQPESGVTAHPSHPAAVARTIRVGGMTKRELLTQLDDAKVRLNESAHVLFAHDGFTTSPAVAHVETAELSVGDLGYAGGATIAQIYDRAAANGLTLCPLELAPHFRLQYLDQPEGCVGHPPSRHRAPPGSLTVASRAPAGDDDTPKGFYLRRIEGDLWLRGYCSGPDHVWSAGDRFVFRRPHEAS
jgi:hypothetical protein